MEFLVCGASVDTFLIIEVEVILFKIAQLGIMNEFEMLLYSLWNDIHARVIAEAVSCFAPVTISTQGRKII